MAHFRNLCVFWKIIYFNISFLQNKHHTQQQKTTTTMTEPGMNVVDFVAVASVERSHKPPPSALTPEHAAALARENRATEGKKQRM